MHTNTYTCIYEHQNNNNNHERNACMTTHIYKWPQKTSLEAENYKRAEQSDHRGEVVETALS